MGEALARAGRFLARQARSEQEVRTHLRGADLDPGLIEQTVRRLKELDLVDDPAFARRWIEERGARKGLGRRRLLAELQLKGVAEETARGAFEELDLDEERQARVVAASLLSRVSRHSPAQQAMRLQRLLLARGFDLDIAMAAVRALLPPEGWD